MLKTFSAGQVTADVLAHLERRRPAIVHDEAAIAAEIRAALEPVRREYTEMELPTRYLDALEQELVDAVPARWRQFAEPFTEEERKGFGLWRGGDVFARLIYVAASMVFAFLAWRYKFLPGLFRWLPFVAAAGAWWLPDLQIGTRRRRYAYQLHEIVAQMEQAQRQLERQVTSEDILEGDASRVDELRARRTSDRPQAATDPQKQNH